MLVFSHTRPHISLDRHIFVQASEHISEIEAPTPTPGGTRRDGGLLGGAPRSRLLHPRYNHAWLFAENRIYRLDGFDEVGGALIELYEILRPDTGQNHVYWCRHLGLGYERNVTLAPDLRMMPNDELLRQGEWKFLPESHDVIPFSPDAFVCLNGFQGHCLRQSTHAPCVRCFGSKDTDHHLVPRSYCFFVEL